MSERGPAEARASKEGGSEGGGTGERAGGLGPERASGEEEEEAEEAEAEEEEEEGEEEAASRRRRQWRWRGAYRGHPTRPDPLRARRRRPRGTRAWGRR